MEEILKRLDSLEKEMKELKSRLAEKKEQKVDSYIMDELNEEEKKDVESALNFIEKRSWGTDDEGKSYKWFGFYSGDLLVVRKAVFQILQKKWSKIVTKSMKYDIPNEMFLYK